MLESTGEETYTQERIWTEYYDAFPYFTRQIVREGCHPRKYIHKNATGKAIVLVHGLSDSSYYMADLAEYFHRVLGYDVYVPLLQCHGLKDPGGMDGVSLEEWTENVRFSITTARKHSDYVSIGGLSMGGALAFYLGCTEKGINGDVYLFAAAFGLASGLFPFAGKLKEWLLRQPFVSILEPKTSLIGDNPYRYNRVCINSAMELVHLMAENSKLLLEIKKGKDLRKRVFSAWSESDDVVDVKALEQMKNMMSESDFATFVTPKEQEVGHACLVLEKPVFAISATPGDLPLEQSNPVFSELVEAISRYESRGSQSC